MFPAGWFINIFPLFSAGGFPPDGRWSSSWSFSPSGSTAELQNFANTFVQKKVTKYFLAVKYFIFYNSGSAAELQDVANIFVQNKSNILIASKIFYILRFLFRDAKCRGICGYIHEKSVCENCSCKIFDILQLLFYSLRRLHTVWERTLNYTQVAKKRNCTYLPVQCPVFIF